MRYPSYYKAAEYMREHRRKVALGIIPSPRAMFLKMYGGECTCCGETTDEFLTLEHVQGQKGVRNKQSGHVSYAKAIKEYRPDLYEVLCYNCNCAKGKLGYCPHQK